MNENLPKVNIRLGLDAGHGSHSNVAFFSYMDHDLPTPSPDHTLVFDVSPTDTGNHYNKFTGIFTAPHSGTYVFTWTSYCVSGGFTYLQAVVNDIVLDSSYCNAAGAQYHRSITGTVVANINQSDAVFIRTHPTGINQGESLVVIITEQRLLDGYCFRLTLHTVLNNKPFKQRTEYL